MDCDDNAVLSVKCEPQTENDSMEGFYIEAIYADFSDLGLGAKVPISTELMEFTFGCEETRIL